VRNLAEMFGDEPDAVLRNHPVAIIESGEIDRLRVAAQGPFTAEIKVNIEVAHREFAQRAVKRLSITAAGEIRFRHRPPGAAHFENREHVIGIIVSFKIPQQWRKSEHPQGGSGEDRPFEAMRGAFP